MATIVNNIERYSLLGNLGTIIVDTDSNVTFVLYYQGQEIVKNIYTPENQRVEIDLKDIVGDYIEYNIPGVELHSSYIPLTFSYQVDDLEMQYFSVLSGGVDADISHNVWFKSNFLTWQPQTAYSQWNQPQWLSYMCLEQSKLIIKGYFADSSTEEVLLVDLYINQLNIFNLQYSSIVDRFSASDLQYFDAWVESASGERLSYIQRYVLRGAVNQDDYFIFANSVGGWDSILFSGKLEDQGANENLIALQSGINKQYSTNLELKCSKNSGFFISKEEAKWSSEFFRSHSVYWVNTEGNLNSIIIENGSYAIAQEEAADFTFVFYRSRPQEYLNLSRTELPAEPIELIDPAGELFFLAPRLSEFADSDLSDEMLIPTQSSFKTAWKKISFGSLKRFILNYIENSSIGTSAHTHANKDVLDNFSESEGSLFYKLKRILNIDQADNRYIRKDVPDVVTEFLTYVKGFLSSNYEQGASKFLGKGFKTYIDEDGKAIGIYDSLIIRESLSVFEIIVNQATYTGGVQYIGNAGMICILVEELETGYKCFFDTKEGQVKNHFQVGDFAYNLQFELNSSDVQSFYWRSVDEVGDDYIVLSKTNALAGSAVPAQHDEIVQLGNSTNVARQSVLIIDQSQGGSIIQYSGIDTFSLDNKEEVGFGVNPSTGEPYFFAYGDFFVGDKNIQDPQATYVTFQKKQGEARRRLFIKADISIGPGSDGLTNLSEWAGEKEEIDKGIKDAQDLAGQVSQDLADYEDITEQRLTASEIGISNLNEITTSLQNQVDGAISSYEGDYTPTLENYPASGWTTNVEKDKHLGDYFDKRIGSGEEVTYERFRFSKIGSAYSWERVADSGSAEALAEARKALGIANDKNKTIYSNAIPPTPYSVNDMWVNIAESGALYLCVVARESGIGQESDWQIINDAMLVLGGMASDLEVSAQEKLTYRDNLSQIESEMSVFREDAQEYDVSIASLENAYLNFRKSNIDDYKIEESGVTKITELQRAYFNSRFATYNSEKVHFANAISEKLTDIKISLLNVAGENILDGSRLFKLSRNTAGRGDSVLIDDGSEEPFYRATPSAGLSVSMYTPKLFSAEELNIQGISLGSDMIDSIYVRHFHTEGVRFKGYPYADSTVVEPGVWTQIYFNTTAVDNYRPIGVIVINKSNANEVVDLPIDYKKQAVRRGNMVVDWSPSIADTYDAINDAIDLAAEVDHKVDELNIYVDGAFKDGVLSETEASVIREQKQTISTLYIEKEKSYNVVYNNIYLNGTTEKTELSTSKIQLDTRKGQLDTAIDNFVNNPTQSTYDAYKLAYTNFDTAVANFQTKLEAANKAIQAKLDSLAQEYTDFLQQVISSKGDQLVENGSLLLGTNYGFPGLEFSGEGYNGSAGSLTRTTTARTHVIGTQNIALDTSKEWLISGAFKSKNGLSRCYAGLMMYDIDGATIQSYEHMYIPDTLTTLAQALEPGDTYVYFNNLDNWIDSSYTFQRGFIFWNYSNTKGYTYPELSYSKNVFSNLYQNSGINRTSKRITLSSPWTGVTVPAGTKVSQSNNGSTYKYSLLSNTLIPDEWADFKGVITGIDYSGTNDPFKFAPGTAFVKLFILWNWNSADDQMWATNLFLQENIAGSITSLRQELAVGLGYDSFEELVAVAELGNTIIKGGYLNTILIASRAITAEQIAVDTIIARNLKTAISGDRVEVTQEDRGMTVFDESDSLVAKFHGKELSEFDESVITFPISEVSDTILMPSQGNNYSGVEDYLLATITVNNPANEIIIPASSITLTANILIPEEENQNVTGQVRILLGSTVLGYASIAAYSSKTEVVSIQALKVSLAPGTHALKAELTYALSRPVDYSVSPTLRVVIDYTSTQGTVRYINKLLEIGESGFRLASDSSRWIGILRNGLEIAMNSKGITTDLPGVLCGYEVYRSGTLQKSYGAKAVTTTASKVSTGNYRVYHNIGHTNYMFIANAHTYSGFCRTALVVSKSSYSAVVAFEDTSSNPVDTDFDIMFFGTN